MEIIFRHLSLSEIGAEQLLKMSKNTRESNTIHEEHPQLLFTLEPGRGEGPGQCQPATDRKERPNIGRFLSCFDLTCRL